MTCPIRKEDIHPFFHRQKKDTACPDKRSSCRALLSPIGIEEKTEVYPLQENQKES